MSTSFTRAVLVTFMLLTIVFCIMGAAAGEEDNVAGSEGNSAKNGYYTVKKGDTLCSIAESTGAPVSNIMVANRLLSSMIMPGQVLMIPGRNPDIEVALSRGFTRDDIMLLARAIHAEARGEPFNGQVAVGAVILNRIKSGKFPGTVWGVVMQKRGETYQFSPVQDGSINMEPDDTAVCAAISAIEGHDPTNGALYFYNPGTARDRWIRTLPVTAHIGNHVFALK